MSTTSAGSAVAVAGYAVAAPFVLWVPLFRRMWHADDARLLLVHEAGVGLVVSGWALRGQVAPALGNAVWGAGLAAAWWWSRR